MAYGASVDAAGDPSQALADTAERHETAKDGAYMNKVRWKRDFYGENHDQLPKVKCKYDPDGNLFVWSVAGSDMWNYDLHSGLLCRVEQVPQRVSNCDAGRAISPKSSIDDIFRCIFNIYCLSSQFVL
ncbi:FAD linked oxidase N-terminal [Penicillium sp. IBT 18751x]|nr:FAD linked oxidase N-terminal [Penicillium sp. IBT 18751x]